MTILTWRQEDANRIFASCGRVNVGAVFPGVHRTRWRAWVTPNMNPVEGTSKSVAEAKAQVEKRFGAFLTKSGLVTAADAATIKSISGCDHVEA